ncbi:MAG: hypothetical protein ACK4WH_08260 [Phycisphaerales bacterium]
MKLAGPVRTLLGLIAAAVSLPLAAHCPGATLPPDPTPSRDRADQPHPPTGGARSRGERELLRQLMSLPPEERRARLRAYLVERQERARRIESALARAIKAIDDGAPVDDPDALMPAESREFRGVVPALGPPQDLPPQTGNGADHTGPGATDPDELGPVSLPGLTGPGRGPRAEESPPRPHEGPITEEDRAVVNEFMSSAAPHLIEMFRQFEQKSPERAEARTREMLGRIRWLIDLRRSDRGEYDLRLEDIRHGREAFDAARELARFDRDGADRSPAQRDEIVARMRAALNEQYRVRGAMIGREIARLESDLDQRRSELARREEARDSAIARTMEKLTERAAEFMKRRERGKKGREDAAN